MAAYKIAVTRSAIDYIRARPSKNPVIASLPYKVSSLFMLHRIREVWLNDKAREKSPGPMEVDETWIGGKRKNMQAAQRKSMMGCGSAGKTAVVGAKDRATNQIAARSVQNTDSETLQGFVREHAAPGAKVYTDSATCALCLLKI